MINWQEVKKAITEYKRERTRLFKIRPDLKDHKIDFINWAEKNFKQKI